MELKLRPLTLEDAADLANIRKTSFEDFWSEDEFKQMLKDESYFGYREDNGFILCRKALDSIDIVTFCVVPEQRKKGTGRRLLNEVIKFASDDKCSIFLEVAEKNQAAKNLYLSAGFKEISVRKNYYKFSSGFQDALVMKIEIKN